MNGRQRFGAELRERGIRSMTRQETVSQSECDEAGCKTRPRFHVEGSGFLCQRHTNAIK